MTKRAALVSFGLVAALVCLGAAPAQAQVVQNCQPAQYLDRTAPGADRQLTWDFSIATDPERCLKVTVGQKVVWNVSPDFDTHPLGGSGGDSPNPIGLHDSSGVVTFDTVGTFGFICLNHSSMKGAILVVAAAAPTSVPALPPRLVLVLKALLLATGVVLIRRRGWQAVRRT